MTQYVEQKTHESGSVTYTAHASAKCKGISREPGVKVTKMGDDSGADLFCPLECIKPDEKAIARLSPKKKTRPQDAINSTEVKAIMSGARPVRNKQTRNRPKKKKAPAKITPVNDLIKSEAPLPPVTNLPSDMTRFLASHPRFTDEAVKKMPDLKVWAAEWVRAYTGDFGFINGLKPRVEQGKQLTYAQTRGVLNTARTHAVNAARKGRQL